MEQQEGWNPSTQQPEDPSEEIVQRVQGEVTPTPATRRRHRRRRRSVSLDDDSESPPGSDTKRPRLGRALPRAEDAAEGKTSHRSALGSSAPGLGPESYGGASAPDSGIGAETAEPDERFVTVRQRSDRKRKKRTPAEVVDLSGGQDEDGPVLSDGLPEIMAESLAEAAIQTLWEELKSTSYYAAFHRLRFPASGVAAIAGLNSHRDPLEMVLDFLYQDLTELAEKDFEIVNRIERAAGRPPRWRMFSSEQEIQEHLMRNLPASDRESLQSALEQRSEYIQQIREVQSDVVQRVTRAESAGKLSRVEGTELRELFRKHLHTKFGHRHEGSALARYAKITSRPVLDSNNRMYIWKFGRDRLGGKALPSAAEGGNDVGGLLDEALVHELFKDPLSGSSSTSPARPLHPRNSNSKPSWDPDGESDHAPLDGERILREILYRLFGLSVPSIERGTTASQSPPPKSTEIIDLTTLSESDVSTDLSEDAATEERNPQKTGPSPSGEPAKSQTQEQESRETQHANGGSVQEPQTLSTTLHSILGSPQNFDGGRRFEDGRRRVIIEHPSLDSAKDRLFRLQQQQQRNSNSAGNNPCNLQQILQLAAQIPGLCTNSDLIFSTFIQPFLDAVDREASVHGASVAGKGTPSLSRDMYAQPEYFTIVGMVDGISSERKAGDCGEEEPILVEVKHRIYKLQDQVPFYEQVQVVVSPDPSSLSALSGHHQTLNPVSTIGRLLVYPLVDQTYLKMLGFRKADVVQCLRSQKKSPESSPGSPSSSSSSAASPSSVSPSAEASSPDSNRSSTSESQGSEPSSKDASLSILRVTLSEMHESGWRNAVMPRLYQFARFIYRLRRKDRVRHKFLLASDEERLEMIREACPYF